MEEKVFMNVWKEKKHNKKIYKKDKKKRFQYVYKKMNIKKK